MPDEKTADPTAAQLREAAEAAWVLGSDLLEAGDYHLHTLAQSLAQEIEEAAASREAG